MNLIAKLGMIYATACHASLRTTALDCLECQFSLPPHSTHYYIQTRHGEGRWSRLQQQLVLWVLCWLPLIASRNTPVAWQGELTMVAHSVVNTMGQATRPLLP